MTSKIIHSHGLLLLLQEMIIGMVENLMKRVNSMLFHEELLVKEVLEWIEMDLVEKVISIIKLKEERIL